MCFVYYGLLCLITFTVTYGQINGQHNGQNNGQINVQINGQLNGQYETYDNKFVRALNHVHSLKNNSYKYSKIANQKDTPDVTLLAEKYFGVIARAENILRLGLAADPQYDVGEVCLNHTKIFIEGLAGTKEWALKMFDAMGKPSSGIFEGNFKWLGSYSECMAVEAVDNDTGVVQYPYKGKHCQSHMSTAEGLQAVLGICLPESCSNADGLALTKTLIDLIPDLQPIIPKFTPTYTICQERTLEYDDKAIVVIVVCSIYLGIMVAATVYDLIIVYVFTTTNTIKKAKHPANSIYGSIPSHFGDVTKTPLLGESQETDFKEKPEAVKRKQHDEVFVVKYEPGKLGRVLLSFSVYTNAAKILSTSQPAGTLTAINGIRFISMTWVILGHTYVFGIGQVANFGPFIQQMTTRLSFTALENAALSVDTFFVLSGLLVSFLSLKEMKKRDGMFQFKWGMYYFHRFWRLTPPYMLWIMVYVTTFKYWNSGPLWSQTGVEQNDCQDTWWKNILYINNIVEPDNMCMVWSWYLANDMQFFVLSPLLLIPLYYSPIWGSVTSLAFLLTTLITTGVTSKHYSLNANGVGASRDGPFWNKVYRAPWCRIGPYVVGFYTGYLLYKSNCKVKMSKLTNMFCWLFATVLALLVLYGTFSEDGSPTMSLEVAALYNAAGRTVWGVCVAWVIFACATGYGGPVNALLSWSAFIPLSRLTYCAYLVHPIVMQLYFLSKQTYIVLYDIEVVYLFLGHTCLSYAAAFLLSLAFESPMMGLEKVLLGRAKNS